MHGLSVPLASHPDDVRSPDRIGFMFDTPEAKIEQVVASVKEVKTAGVMEFGIGEPFPMHLFGWKDGALVAIGRQGLRLLARPESQQVKSMAHCAQMFRQAWGADAITLVTDGFVADADEDEVDESRSLAEQFVDNPAVSQALLISHAEHEGGPDGLVTGNVIGLRFTEGFGRLVSFDDPVPIGFDEVSLSDSYIVHVCDALLNDAERTTHPADTYESFIGRMVEGLEQRGWFVSNELTHP